MTDIDIGYLRQWIGREEGATDLVTSGLVQRFEATLGTVAHRASDAAPLAVHWCLAPPTVPPDEIGPDGHPRRGGFLPPVPLPRRMWAGGELSLHEPLRTGEEATRSSRIANVELKSGRAGNLVFVTCEHRIASGGRLTISERQDIVYREAEAAGRPKAAPASPAEARIASHTEWIEATTMLLFRYSALTFNGHRIHYDVATREQSRVMRGWSCKARCRRPCCSIWRPV